MLDSSFSLTTASPIPENGRICRHARSWFATALLALAANSAFAEIVVHIATNDIDIATAGFRFEALPPPSVDDAARHAAFRLVSGRRDGNGGLTDVLNDGLVPGHEDQPRANYFLQAGSSGGRLLLDLGTAIEISQVNSYSWHPKSRGPQVYALYGSDGTAEGFAVAPAEDTPPETRGWTRIATVDTRPTHGSGGGQYGVSIAADDGPIGHYRYLLFDIRPTETDDPFGHTFFSEIDVLDAAKPPPSPIPTPAQQTAKQVVTIGDGKYRIVIDTSQTPDITDWAETTLVPMVRDWYPKLVTFLPSEGFEPARRVTIAFDKDMRGVAATGGAHIRCAASWFRANLRGEALGAVAHELVHVVQDYGRAPRGAPRPPGWLVEGIADYMRFFVFEPQTRGADISRRGYASARYDGSYRISANFLNWTTENRCNELVPRVNAAIREGRYNDNVWKTLTGQTLDELNDAWRDALAKKLGIAPPAGTP